MSVNRIGIRALEKLYTDYRNQLSRRQTSIINKLKDDLNNKLEVFVHDLTEEDFKSNFHIAYNNGQILVDLVKEKNSADICGKNTGIICPLLDEYDEAYSNAEDSFSDAVDKLRDWYHASMKPVDFQDFNIDEHFPVDE